MAENLLNGLCGLNNLGNTCYMNSVIQCLSHTKRLRDFLLSGEYKNYTKESCQQFIMLNELNNLIRELWLNGNRVVSPNNFFSHLQMLSFQLGNGQFVGRNQNDSGELLIFILDLLHESLATILVQTNIRENNLALEQWKLIYKNGESPILNTFYNQVETKIKCGKCNNITYNYQPTSLLHLPIPNTSFISLDDCLEKFSLEEELNDDNLYNCERCNEYVIAKRTDHIYKTNDYLIIVLERFDKNGIKNNQPVDFPTFDLDLSPYMTHNIEKRYKLYGIVNHIGGMNGGHYFSYIENNGQWYEFNDSSVRTIPIENIVSSSAYILFYQAN